MPLIKVTNIDWDTDGEDVDDLPNSLIFEFEDEEYIADVLSDHYGWCINSFDYESGSAVDLERFKEICSTDLIVPMVDGKLAITSNEDNLIVSRDKGIDIIPLVGAEVTYLGSGKWNITHNDITHLVEFYYLKINEQNYIV